jgi:MFS family permease
MNPASAEGAAAQRSMRSVVREGTSSSIMSGAGETYFAAYALFLRANAGQIAFLAAIPSLLGSVTQLLSAWIGHRTGRHKPIILAGVLLQAFAWLPIIWLPYFFPQHAVTALIGSIVLYHLGSNLANPMWNSLMGDIVPEDQRGRYFARRARLMNLASFIALSGAGFILHLWGMQDQTRVGFLTVFTIAMAARFYSAYQITLIDEPRPAHGAEKLIGWSQAVQDLTRSNFAKFSVFMALMNFAVGIAGPFFTMFMLKDLGFSYLQFTLITASIIIAQFFTLSMWGRSGDAFGNRLVLAVTGFTLPVMPLLWLVSGNFWFILAIQLLSGIAWSGFTLSAGNFMYDTVARGKRPVYGAIHNTLSSAGAFVGAMLGGYLGTHVGTGVTLFGTHIELASNLYWVFLVSSIIRLATAVSFIPLLAEVRSVPRLSVLAFLVHLARTGVQPLAVALLPLARRKAG